MLIKKYIANNINEAMTKIKYELGKNAVIISQRKVRKPGIKGLFSSKMIEVTAAVENSEDKYNLKKPVMKQQVEENNPLQDKVQQILRNKTMELKQQEERVQEKQESKEEKLNASDILKEMHDMKKIISKMADKENQTENQGNLFKIKKILRDNDFDYDIIDSLINEYKNRYSEEDENYINNLKEILKEKITLEQTDVKGAMILVGPTGVGKTTTIAKLAGKLALIEKKKVGLITIDTYRIGAVEQLKTYAEIMNIPFKVVITLKDMDEAISELKDCDVILVDTTGRSSKNTMQISELRAFVDKVKTNNISLVISATTKNRDIEPIVNGFKNLNYNSVIITKLDETTAYGSIINIVSKSNKPIKYLTVGQNVPDDIKILSKEKIIDLSLGEDSIC